jgi:hypothetical protein
MKMVLRSTSAPLRTPVTAEWVRSNDSPSYNSRRGKAKVMAYRGSRAAFQYPRSDMRAKLVTANRDRE